MRVQDDEVTNMTTWWSKWQNRRWGGHLLDFVVNWFASMHIL